MAGLRVLPGGKKDRRWERRRKIIAAIMIGFNQMWKCPECGAVYFDDCEEGDRCPRCYFLDDKEVELFKVTEVMRRKMLKEWVGKMSLREMDEGELLFVLGRLREMGYRWVKKGTLRDAVEASRRGMIARINEVAPFVLGDNWERRLRGFCKKAFGKEALEWLSLFELRRVWGFLRGNQKIQRKIQGKGVRK